VTVWIEPLKEHKALVVQPDAPTIVPVPSPCSVPNLADLTVAEAEASAAHAGCKLTVEGAPLERADIQTVARQSPEAGQSGESVAVWVNPFCAASAEAQPGGIGPTATPGPTELVSGFYLDGGPLDVFSNPGCSRPEQPSGAGAVEVLNEAGEVVATGTSEYGHLVEVPLPAGTYKFRATFLDASINGEHPIESSSVEIPPGDTVRLNFVLSIP
jgi:hypothetical protein